MKIKYYTTPSGVNISCIGKNGSSAIGKAILEQLYPEKMPTLLGADASNSAGWQAFVPRIESPEAAIVIVRDPVERFRSAVSQIRRTDDVDALLTESEAGERMATNDHFLPVMNYLVEESTLYQFPEQITDIAAAAGLTDIPSVNDNSNNPPKPDLTPEQQARVEAIYADDIALYESITVAGQTYSAPATDADKEAKLAEIRAARDAEYRSVLTTSDGLQFKADLETIIDIQTITSMLVDAEDVYPNYKTANGEYHDISKAQFDLAIAEGIQRKAAAFGKEFSLASQVQQAATVAELDAIGW